MESGAAAGNISPAMMEAEPKHLPLGVSVQHLSKVHNIVISATDIVQPLDSAYIMVRLGAREQPLVASVVKVPPAVAALLPSW